MSERKLRLSKEELEQLYWGEELNQTQIGEIYGVDKTKISYWMKRDGIKTRGARERKIPLGFKEPSREKLERLYHEEGKSQKQLSEIYGISTTMVGSLIDKNNLRKKRPRGYWIDWRNFERELTQAIEENNGEFPTKVALEEGGKRNLSSSFTYHGGVNAVRERMGYSPYRKPIGYWRNSENFERELTQTIEENNGEFPTTSRLHEMGRDYLISIITKNYGGMNAVRERMGFNAPRMPSGYWKEWKNVKLELEQIIKKNEGKFPTMPKLQEMGKGNIFGSYKYHGGMNAVRERMGFPPLKRKPNGYWEDPNNLKAELEKVIEENGGEFPTSSRLKEIGRIDLLVAMRTKGGINATRKEMGYSRDIKDKGYWKDQDNFERELRQAIEENGGEFPTIKELSEMGMQTLTSAISVHYGGINTVRERMGYPVRKAIRTSDQLINFLQENQKARNLAGMTLALNGQGHDIEEKIAEEYSDEFPKVAGLHKLMQDGREPIMALIEKGITNLGEYIGDYTLDEDQIIPSLIQEGLKEIPDTELTLTLESRLSRALRNHYGPKFNDNPEEILAEVKQKADSTDGHEKTLYEKLQAHYEKTIALGKELKR